MFAQNPALRGYVLDDQGEVRRHVSIFVGGEQIRDRARQSDAIPDGAEIYIMQALSGGWGAFQSLGIEGAFMNSQGNLAGRDAQGTVSLGARRRGGADGAWRIAHVAHLAEKCVDRSS